MARIVYAASGDGYGHAVRAHSVAEGLLQRGHDVRFVCSHRAIQYLGEHFPGRVHEVLGLLTTYRDGRADIFDTVVRNTVKLWRSARASNTSLKRMLQDYRPDLVITDFEPFTAFWARRTGVPYISLDNQHLLTHCELEHPAGFTRDIFNAYLAIRLYYGGAKRYLITSFIRAPIRYHPTTLVDPVLRPQVYARKAERGDFLLAYKGAGGDNVPMQRVLEENGRAPIRAYGFGVSGRRGTTEFKPFCSEEFLRDLAGCSAVIASAGHSLVSECLYFEKPMLLVPIAQQYEQLLNAYHVEKLGAGMAVHRLTAAAIDEFVDRIDSFRAAISRLPKASLEPVLDAIERELP